MILPLLLACHAPAPHTYAQWVWTADDATVLAEARQSRPVVAGVHVATTHFAAGAFTNTLALPPTDGVIVIRLDDDVHAAWATLDDGAVATGLGEALGRVLAMAKARGPVTEVQLDYDAPVRLLPRYGAVLHRLREGPLAGQALWVTSLVAHARDPAYVPALRGAVDGHILQVFDTGDDPGSASQIAGYAASAGLPYRLGVGAFERETTPPTQHRAWFDRLDVACPAPLCEAVWVFPAGRSWVSLAR